MKRIAISAFLLFHLVAITCWCVPLDSALIVACRNAIRPYFLFSGLFQSWDPFAPTPRTINSYLEAIVIYNDGAVRTWKFLRMDQLSFTDRYLRERYRKFEENLQEEANRALWPDAARYVARVNNDVSNPPQIIMLIRHRSEIVPYADRSSRPQRWHTQIFYEYDVKPADLK